MTVPLTPPDCDLQDSKFMPMYVQQMLNSSFNAMADDTAWRAGVTLWMRSWFQVPAASLPDDDEELCQFAGFGRDMKTWTRVKTKALRGWSVADDGRLYHPVLAEAALETWISRLLSRISSGAGNTKKYGIEFDADAVETQLNSAYDLLKAINPNADGIKKLDRRKAYRDSDGKADKKPTGKRGGKATGNPTGTTPGDEPGNAPGSQAKAEAEGKAPTGESISIDTLSPSGGGVRDFGFEDFRANYPPGRGGDAAERAWEAALDDGATSADIITGLSRAKEQWRKNQTADRYIPLAVNWLEKRGWLNFGGGSHTALAGRAWPGPEAIREAILIELGQDEGERFAKSYLDPADWLPPSTIAAATDYAVTKLRTILRLKTYTIRKRTEEAAA